MQLAENSTSSTCFMQSFFSTNHILKFSFTVLSKCSGGGGGGGRGAFRRNPESHNKG